MKSKLVFMIVLMITLVVQIWESDTAVAQVTYGSFRGVVTDPSGAAVPAASVTAVLTDRGLSRNTTTGADGSYEFPGLLPGTYSVTVEKVGFKKYTDNSLVLYPRDLRRLD